MSRPRKRCLICGSAFYPDDEDARVCPECEIAVEDDGFDLEEVLGMAVEIKGLL